MSVHLDRQSKCCPVLNFQTAIWEGLVSNFKASWQNGIIIKDGGGGWEVGRFVGDSKGGGRARGLFLKIVGKHYWPLTTLSFSAITSIFQEKLTSWSISLGKH